MRACDAAIAYQHTDPSFFAPWHTVSVLIFVFVAYTYVYASMFMSHIRMFRILGLVCKYVYVGAPAIASARVCRLRLRPRPAPGRVRVAHPSRLHLWLVR